MATTQTTAQTEMVIAISGELVISDSRVAESPTDAEADAVEVA